MHRLRRGDLVVPLVRRPCLRGECRACRMGRPDFCQSGEFVQRGIRGAHGFLAEAVVEDARWLVPVPPELRDVGVLVQPLALAEKALADLEAARRWPTVLPRLVRRNAFEETPALLQGRSGGLKQVVVLGQ